MKGTFVGLQLVNLLVAAAGLASGSMEVMGCPYGQYAAADWMIVFVGLVAMLAELACLMKPPSGGRTSSSYAMRGIMLLCVIVLICIGACQISGVRSDAISWTLIVVAGLYAITSIVRIVRACQKERAANAAAAAVMPPADMGMAKAPTLAPQAQGAAKARVGGAAQDAADALAAARRRQERLQRQAYWELPAQHQPRHAHDASQAEAPLSMAPAAGAGRLNRHDRHERHRDRAERTARPNVGASCGAF
jgi:hypothetical protein